MQKGITLIELLVVIAIVGILASAAMPFSRVAVQRTKEIELRGNLRLLRTAIDEFKKDCDLKKLSQLEGYCKPEQYNYPETLEQLTEPLKLTGAASTVKRYLRRIPRDPMTTLEAAGQDEQLGAALIHRRSGLPAIGAAEMCLTFIQRAKRFPWTDRNTIPGD